MLWLEQSHPPRFSAFGEGPIQSLLESFDCAICWIVIYNAATAEYGYTEDAEPLQLRFFNMIEILQWSWRTTRQGKTFPLGVLPFDVLGQVGFKI